MMTLALSEQWDELAKTTKIYQTILGWDTCKANVLANKIRSVENYYENFMAYIDDDEVEELYKRFLKNDFKQLQDKFEYSDHNEYVMKEPTTWSCNIDRRREIAGIEIDRNSAVRMIKDKKQRRITEIDVYVNDDWKEHYHRWLNNYVVRMKERFEAEKIKTASTAKASANESFTCSICGGIYTRSHKSHHLKTSRHKKALEEQEK